MARIASLGVLLSTEGNDFLKEEYGKVIENIQKKSLSARVKNTSLSGNPTSGTVEAKRFANRTSNAYGTARRGGAGQKVKAKPVVIAIDTDKELITEIEQKDVSLYGVDNFVQRQASMDEKSMKNELERAFWAVAKTAGTQLTLSSTSVEDIAEEMIQSVTTVKNDYVDGVERDDVVLSLDSATFGKLRTYLDKVSNGEANGAQIGYYHGVEVQENIWLPEGVTKGIVMVKGSVAQPVLPSIQPASRIPLSNAIATGLFYSYGTKAVSEDLIFWA